MGVCQLKLLFQALSWSDFVLEPFTLTGLDADRQDDMKRIITTPTSREKPVETARKGEWVLR
jgi:hypothetical protein